MSTFLKTSLSSIPWKTCRRNTNFLRGCRSQPKPYQHMSSWRPSSSQKKRWYGWEFSKRKTAKPFSFTVIDQDDHNLHQGSEISQQQWIPDTITTTEDTMIREDQQHQSTRIKQPILHISQQHRKEARLQPINPATDPRDLTNIEMIYATFVGWMDTSNANAPKDPYWTAWRITNINFSNDAIEHSMDEYTT